MKSNYMNANQMAKKLKLTVETVRKRAAAGKIDGAKKVGGEWRFDQAPSAKMKQRTRVVFVIDRSGSMNGLSSYMKKAIDAQISEFKSASDAGNSYEVGFVTFESKVDAFEPFRDVSTCITPEIFAAGGTALCDAMLVAIKKSEAEMSAAADMATLVVVVTDGEENSSSARPADVSAAIVSCMKSGRFTIAANCPPGHTKYFLSLGIPKDNVREWEQTFQGVERYTAANIGATRSYTSSRATGQTMSTAYYAQPVVADADQFAILVNNTMDDVTSAVKVERVMKTDPVVIRDFCEKKFGGFVKGSIYYQLLETEKVQEYKKIIVQDTTTGKFFQGWDMARKLLGLPAQHAGTIKIKPGALGEFKVFVQSTSYNRKLDPGSSVIKF